MARSYEKPLLENIQPTSFTKLRLCLVLCFTVALGMGFFAGSTVNLNFHIISSQHIPLSHVCDNAHEPSSCIAIVSEVASNGALRRGDIGPLEALLGKSMLHFDDTMRIARNASLRINNDPKHRESLEVCEELFDMSMDRLRASSEFLAKNGVQGINSDVHAWLSAVLTNHFTCLDGLIGQARSLLEPLLNDIIARDRASLALHVALSPKKSNYLFAPLIDKFPSWVTSKDRKLLGTLSQYVKANVVVAKDGSGNYKTVCEAVAAAPDKSPSRYVIYIKKGTYKENVIIGKNKKNLMIVGDGMASTVITGSLNFIDGTGTYSTATVAVEGDGFIAQDIRFENTAGPEKHQAVALRVSADLVVINRCQIDAYQDTLYAHTLRQFYRDCQITGTVDFIFGDAAVVIQNSKIVARKPMSGQFNAVTAQGRVDPNQNTGTSIQSCQIVSSSDLSPCKGSFKTYLGRPWKRYSRTVILQSYIEDHVHPSGWALWDDATDTTALYYGEYANKGPGAETSYRVKWPGHHAITNAAEARKFTVAELIQGNVWLPSTGVTFSEGL